MAETVETPDDKWNKANTVINYHAAGGAAASAVPVPGVDLLLLAAVQLDLVRALANVYSIDHHGFTDELGKSLIAALVGTNLPGVGASFLKVIPIVGSFAGLGYVAFAGASTYAIGKVFQQHFESGGNLLNFDAKKAKEYYSQHYKEFQKAPS